MSLNIINYLRTDRLGHYGFPVNKIMNYLNTSKDRSRTTYGIPWDFQNNKMRPGKYTTKLGVEYEVNSLGFRGNEFDPIQKSKYRIICFGGSSTIGLESTDVNTYPALLETELKNNGIDAEVLNFGFSSKSLNFIFNLLVNEAVHYGPDLILIYSNRNTALYDASNNHRLDIQIGRHNNLLLQLNYFLYDHSMIYWTLAKLNAKRNTYFSRFRSSKKRSNLEDVNFNFHGKDVTFHKRYFFEDHPKILGRILKLSEVYDFKVGLIKQPIFLDPALQQSMKNYSLDKLWQMMTEKSSVVYQKHSAQNPYWIVSNAMLNRQLDLLKGDQENLLIIDPLDEFLGENSNYKDLFYDYVHLTSKGNELLAKIIEENIRPAIEIINK